MSTLIKLEQEWLEMQSIFQENDGELTPELENQLDTIYDEIIKKQDSYLFIIDQMKKQIENGKDWVKKFQTKIKSLETQQKRMNDLLIANMESTGINKLEGELGKISLYEREAVEVYDESLVPEKFKTEVVSVKISKSDIQEAFKKGEDVLGARQLKNKHLRVT